MAYLAVLLALLLGYFIGRYGFSYETAMINEAVRELKDKFSDKTIKVLHKKEPTTKEQDVLNELDKKIDIKV